MGNYSLPLLVFIAIALLSSANVAQCARILGIFPMPARSHYNLGSALMRGLAQKGHDVTVVSPFGEKEKPKGGSYRDVLLTGFLEVKHDMNMFDFASLNPLLFSVFMSAMGNEMSEKVFAHSNVQKLVDSGETFDVVIVEQFVNDAHKVFAWHFKAPLIIFSTFGSNAWVNSLVANPAPPSYVPEIVIDFNKASFIDRLKNNLFVAYNEVVRQILFYPAQNKIMKKYFPDAPDLDAINYNASLVLLNSHLSTNAAVPRVPCMIDIGGYHVQPPKKLPKDLQTFLDSAKDGVIYFSMGSALQSVNFPEEKRKILLSTFSKLKMKVLWKWESDVLPGQPSNVLLNKWLPQQDVLAHPNVKLFITHGGLLSLIESVYHGKQVLAIPVFGDQKINAVGAVTGGYGKAIPYDELAEKILEDSINELLTNPKYSDNVKRRSKIMHDRIVKPMDEADYWIQYVIRHQGATHLKVDGLSLPWYQYLSVDVALFVGVVVSIYLYLLVKVMAWIISKICTKGQKQTQKKVKKN